MISGDTTISLALLVFTLSFYKQKYLFEVEKKCHTARSSIRNSVKERIGDSCGYTSKLDLTSITTCYHHLVIIFYSLSISLKDLHVCTGSGIKRSSNVWDGEKNATAP